MPLRRAPVSLLGYRPRLLERHSWQDGPSGTPGFVAGVIHTHLHDLAADGQTHWPFSEGRVPRWQHTWDALRGVGYQGVFNLEMYPAVGGGQRRVKEGILESIDMVAACAAGGQSDRNHEQRSQGQAKRRSFVV